MSPHTTELLQNPSSTFLLGVYNGNILVQTSATTDHCHEE